MMEDRMSRPTVAALAAGAILVAACSASGGTASASPSGASVCVETADPGSVAVSIEDFEFVPGTVVAKPGQVIAFTNAGFEHHNATVDGGGCATKTMETGQHDGLVFTAAGSYPFHCTVHAWMAGTIRIAG